MCWFMISGIKSNSFHAVELTETKPQTNFEPIKILAFYVRSESAQIGFSNESTKVRIEPTPNSPERTIYTLGYTAGIAKRLDYLLYFHL